MTLKLAIWDMDGTIVDSRDVIQTAMAEAFQAHGLAPPNFDETRKTIGLSLGAVIAALAPEYADQGGLAQTYKDVFVSRRKVPGFTEPLYEGAREALEHLANDNWLIAMATGKSRQGIQAMFEHHPLAQYFDTIWCADDGPGKPNPFMCDEAMKAVGAAPGQSLMIGDAVHDMRMARAAGVRAIGVDWGFGLADELEQAGAHEVHSSFTTLNESLGMFAREPV